MEITRDEVRVMTVHGAKGLEAPIVVLADSITPPSGPAQRQDRLFNLAPGKPGAPIVWAGKKMNDVTQLSAARDRMRREAEDEYRRLLYVAMTRASDRLIVCGADGDRKRPDGCWWNSGDQRPAAAFQRGICRRWRRKGVALSEGGASSTLDKRYGGATAHNRDTAPELAGSRCGQPPGGEDYAFSIARL